jgi:hypothetical protein
MGIEDYIPDESVWESGGSWAEKASEISEKFKKSVKKASAWIARTKKDEKKAQKQDIVLAGFLVKIILNKKYDVLLENLFKLIDKWIASNFILGIMSLVYIDISNEIRKHSWKEKIIFEFVSKEIIDFDDSNLDKNIRERINLWIEDINDILSIEYSSLITQKLIHFLETDENIIHFVWQVFSFFLKEININITTQKAYNIANFITGEILKNLKKLKLEKI